MVTSHERGHLIYWSQNKQSWFYLDTNKKADDSRPCLRCKQIPTPEGFDACLGYIEGVKSACCGHGVIEGFKRRI